MDLHKIKNNKSWNEIMLKLLTIFTIIILIQSRIIPQDQNENYFRLVGGSCEGCEAILEFGENELFSSDTLPDFNDAGQKLKLAGTIYQQDGTTPAKDVILYIYHTNQNGIYPTHGDETGWAKRHGYLRGWIKTDSTGKYTFYTLKPGTYPSRNAPAHIHAIILEPNGTYYWIEEYIFDNDPLISEDDKNNKLPRGGSGILTLREKEKFLVGDRDIILGQYIPDYD